MAPPTPLINPDQLKIPTDCPLVRIIQYECDLSQIFVQQQRAVCVPTERLYRACADRNYEISPSVQQKLRRITDSLLQQGRDSGLVGDSYK